MPRTSGRTVTIVAITAAVAALGAGSRGGAPVRS